MEGPWTLLIGRGERFNALNKEDNTVLHSDAEQAVREMEERTIIPERVVADHQLSDLEWLRQFLAEQSDWIGDLEIVDLGQDDEYKRIEELVSVEGSEVHG